MTPFLNTGPHGNDALNEALAEITKLRLEVHALRGEILEMRRALSLHPPRTHHPDTLHCHVCGGPLGHHPAPAGELILCPACGWSEFVDHNGAEYYRFDPEPVPAATTATHDWAT